MKKIKNNSMFAALVVMMTSMTGLAQTPVTIHSQNTPTISVDAFDIEGFEFERVEEQTATIDEWIDLGLPSGLLWRSSNFGAGYPTAAGTFIPYQTWKENSNDYLAIISDYGMRSPGEEDIEELFANCVVEKTEIDGIVGIKFTGLNGNSIFLPAAGIHYTDDSNLWRNMLCQYWAYQHFRSDPIEVLTIGIENPMEKHLISADYHRSNHPLANDYKELMGHDMPDYCLCIRPVKDTKTDVIYDCQNWPSFELKNDGENTVVFEIIASKTPVISSEDDFVSWEIAEAEEVALPDGFDWYFGSNPQTLNDPFRKWIVTFTLLPNNTDDWREATITFKGGVIPWGPEGKVIIRQAPDRQD